MTEQSLASSPLEGPRWTDPDADVELRVRELLAHLSLEEKIAQLSGIWVGADRVRGEIAPEQHEFAGTQHDWTALVKHGLGQLTRPYGTAPIDPIEGAHGLVELQRTIIGAGRLAIPAMVHEECLTGLSAWQATAFPSPLCWGASFDPDLVERMGAQIGSTMHRLGIHQGLAPVLDVARDLRWGRIEETIAEDPYLVGSIASAYVRGIQSQGIIATLKHFVGYSASRAARNLAPVSAGPREIADVLLPPFEMALRAGAASVMNSYADIDGVPVAADVELLTGLLRDTYAFTGTVVADYFAVSFLQALHHVAASEADAAVLALRAGIDVELPTVHCYGSPLLDKVRDGTIDEALVDRAVRRVLTQKCQLGLLDADWSPEPPVLREDLPVQLDDAQSRHLAHELVMRSAVLLHNRGALPLSPQAKLAVVGPRADTAEAMLGCYSFHMHVGVHHPDIAVGVEIDSLVAALRTDPAAYQVSYELGCPVQGGDDESIVAAARAAADSDVCIAVLGDRAGLFGGGTSGEGCDASDLRLPGRQEELLEAVLATGTPVVLVLLVGRPYELSRQLDRLAAVVCGFFPGEEGAPALAELLSGRSDFAGRLPVSFPAARATQPSTYLAAPLGRRNKVSMIDPTPLFPFGHGLSYSPVTWEAVIEADAGMAPRWPTDGTFGVDVTLFNASDGPASEVVQVYLHDPVAEVARPVQLLVAAPRVDLASKERRTVRIEVHADQSAYTGVDGRRRVEPGEVQLWVGASSADIRAELQATLDGPVRYVGFDRVMYPTVHDLGAR